MRPGADPLPCGGYRHRRRALALGAALALPGCEELGLPSWTVAPEAPPAAEAPAVTESGRLTVRARAVPLPEAAGEADGGIDGTEGPPQAMEPLLEAMDLELQESELDAAAEAQNGPEPRAGEMPEAEADRWEISPARHASLRAALEEWAQLAGWGLEWRAKGLDFRASARAVYDGGFLEAVGALLDSAELGGRLRAEAYEANRWLVVREAGP